MIKVVVLGPGERFDSDDTRKADVVVRVVGGEFRVEKNRAGKVDNKDMPARPLAEMGAVLEIMRIRREADAQISAVQDTVPERQKVSEGQ